VDLHSKEEFEQCIEGSAVTAIQFTAGWCGPCKRIGPLYASLAEQYSGEGKVFARIDIDELSEVAVQKGVMSIPAFHVYRKGDLAKKMQGADSKKLEALCLQYFGKAD
jgi:thiol-disulfide isomerase/thioredoxin